jgi:hypothetical protein
MASFERFTTKTRFNSLKRLVLLAALATLAVKLACAALATAAGGGSLPGFLLRTLASLADLAAALLVFEVLRHRRPLHQAAQAAALVGTSPVLLVASGVRGDRAGVAVLFLLAAMWLLVDREAPLAAGLAVAVAVRVEPLALVALPVALAAAAWPERAAAGGRLARRAAGWAGRDRVAHLALAFGAATAAAWAPALAWGWQPLGPAGPAGHAGPAALGLGWVAARLGHPGLAGPLASPGRAAVLCAAALPAALWVRRRPRRAYAAVGLVLLAAVALDPAPSPRDLVLPVVFGYLGDARWASVYGLVAGATLVWTSTFWDRGLPWAGTAGGPADGVSTLLCLLTWAVLLVWLGLGWRTVAVEGSWRAARRPRRRTRAPAGVRDEAEPTVPIGTGTSRRSAPVPK